MIRVRLDGEAAWCGRPGCNYPEPLATIHHTEDGEPWAARLSSHRWREDGYQDGMRRFVMVNRTGRIVRTDAKGRTHRLRNLDMRAPLPIVVVCPLCGTVQVIGLDL